MKVSLVFVFLCVSVSGVDDRLCEQLRNNPFDRIAAVELERLRSEEALCNRECLEALARGAEKLLDSRRFVAGRWFAKAAQSRQAREMCEAFLDCELFELVARCSDVEGQLCPACGGTQESDCRACGSVGFVRCDACKGYGQVDRRVPGWDAPMNVRCELCGGAGMVICQQCDGDGVVMCRECGNGDSWSEMQSHELLARQVEQLQGAIVYLGCGGIDFYTSWGLAKLGSQERH